MAPTPSDRPLRAAVTVEQCWHRVPGGTATSILGLARALARRGDVELVGLAARHADPPADDLRPPMPVRHLPLGTRGLYLAWTGSRRPAVDHLVTDVDVVHATAVAIPPTRRPLVVTIHDLAFRTHPEHATRWGRVFFERGTSLTRRHATIVTCPSVATADECLAAGIDLDRIRVVPWGLDWEVASDDAVAAARDAYGLPERFVLWVGTIEPRKNLGTVLRAHSLLGDGTPLVLVGPQGWHEEVPADRQQVRVLGHVPHGDLPAIYRAASCFCYPSLREGFGLPVLEAMSQATPVVTSSGTATAEVAGDAGMLVDPTDTRAVADAIASVLADDQLASELSRAGLERARTMTWDASAAAMVDVYREAIERRP